MAQCAGCQAQIFDKYLFNVVDRSWHGRCLQCQDCSMPLSEKCFFKEGKLFCRTDFYKRYGTKCFGCGEGICPTDLVRRARSKVFHVKCFKCMICRKQLCTGEELYVVGEEFYLCRDDYLNSYHQQQQPFRHHLYTADISCNEHGPPPYFQNNFPVGSISTTAEPLLTPFQLVPDNFTTPRSFFNPIMKLPLSAGSNIPPFMKKPQKSLKIRQPKCKGGILLPSANPKEEYSPRKKEGGGGAEKQGQPMDESDHLKFSLPQQQPKSAKMSPITTSSSLGASKIRKKKCTDKFQKLPSQGNHISKKSITIKQEQQEDTTTATIVEKEKPKGFADENLQELRGTTVMTLTSCYNDEPPPPPPPQTPATSKSPPKDFGPGGICDENWNDRYTNANFATSSSGSILDNEMIINFSNETTGASATISTTKMTGDVKLENNLSSTESYHHSYSSAFLEHDINNKNQNNVPLNEENYHDHHQVMRRAQQEATGNSCCNKQQLQSLVADQKMDAFEKCDIKNKAGFDFEFATSNHCRPHFRPEGGGGRTAARSSHIDMMYDDEVEMEGSDDYDEEEEDDDADLDLEEGGADYDEEGEDEDSLLLIEEDMEDEDVDENAFYGTDRAPVNAFPKRPFDPSAGGYDMPPPSMSYPLQPESSTTSDNNDNNLVLPNQNYSSINQSSSSRPQGPNSRSNSPPSSSGGVLGLSSNNNNNRKNSFHHHHHHLSSVDHQKFPLESGCGSNNSNAYYNSCLSHHHQTGFSGGGGLMPSNGSGGGAGGSCNNKRRGPRTTIKAKQLETLKSAFSATPKPTRHIREQLARETGLNMRVIQVWFQNRRSKERRMKQLSALGARRHFFRHTRRIRSSMIRPELTGIGNMGAASSTIITQGPPHSNQHPHQHPGLGQMRTDVIPNEQDPNCQQMYPPALIQQHSHNPTGNAGSPVDDNNMSNNNPNNNTRQPWETISNYHHHNTTDITISISANTCPGGQYVDIKSSTISNDPNVVPSFDHSRHHPTSISYLNNPNTGELLISEYKDGVPAAPPSGKGNLLINLYPPFPDFSNGINPTVAELETSSIHAPLQNYRLLGNSSNLLVDEENHGRPNENTQTQNARLIPCEEDAQTKLYESLDNENYTFNNNRAIGSTEINPYYSHHHISASESRENSNENYLHSSSHMMKTTLIGGSSEPCQYYTPNITEFTGL